jgi:hypothetical protein
VNQYQPKMMRGLLHEVPMLGLVVKDRGANVRAAGEELMGEDDAGDSIHCAAHLTKSVVDAVVLNSKTRYYDKQMSRDVDVLLKVAAHIRGNEDARRVFRNNAPPAIAHLEPLKDNPTRWEGIDICLRRALKMQQSWKNFCGDATARMALLEACNQDDSDFPSDAFFARVAVYKDLLDPLRFFSKECQKQNNALMPRLIFLIAKVEDAFAPRREDGRIAGLRAKLLASVKEYLLPLVRGTTVATKAALLSPESVGLEKYLSEDVVNQNWKEIKHDALLLLAPSDTMKVAAEQACKAQVTMARALLSEAAAGRMRPDWKSFWQSQQNKVPLFMPIVRLYMSMPISSVKPETVFSYTGNLVTKKTASWEVSSVEAMVVVNDFTRQADYSFNVVLEEMALLVAEQDAHTKAQAQRKREAKRAQLAAQMEELDAEDDNDADAVAEVLDRDEDEQ